MIRAYLLGGCLFLLLALGAGLYLKGRSDGKQLERAAQLEITRELNEELSRMREESIQLEATRLRQVRELNHRVTELKEAAYEDPHAARPALSLSGVRRINELSRD